MGYFTIVVGCRQIGGPGCGRGATGPLVAVLLVDLIGLPSVRSKSAQPVDLDRTKVNLVDITIANAQNRQGIGPDAFGHYA